MSRRTSQQERTSSRVALVLAGAAGFEATGAGSSLRPFSPARIAVSHSEFVFMLEWLRIGSTATHEITREPNEPRQPHSSAWGSFLTMVSSKSPYVAEAGQRS